MPRPTEVLALASFLGCPRMTPRGTGCLAQVYFLKDPISRLDLQRSQSLAYWLVVAPLYLLLWSLMTQGCSCQGRWSSPAHL